MGKRSRNMASKRIALNRQEVVRHNEGALPEHYQDLEIYLEEQLLSYAEPLIVKIHLKDDTVKSVQLLKLSYD